MSSIVGLGMLVGCSGPIGPAAASAPGMRFVLEQFLATDAQATPVGTARNALDPAGTSSRAVQPDNRPSVPPAAPAVTGGAASRLTGRVLDEVEQPVAGALVLFAAGGTARTDAEGRYAIAGAPGGGCFVSAAGHVTSVVMAGDLPEVLHLRRLEPGAASFDSQEVTIRGSVTWPAPAHLGGAVYYRDDHGSYSDPVVVDAEGLFALRVQTRRGGEPRGVVLALAAGPDDTPMIGLSQTFRLFQQGAEPVHVPITVAGQVVRFAAANPPAGLPALRSRLEITPPGMAPFVLEGEAAVSGQFQVPASGALPATLRIAVEASNDQQERSLVAMDPYAMPAQPPSFMRLPALQVDVATRTIAWSGVEAGRGQLLEVRQAPRLAESHWEGWLEGRSEHVFEADHWPTGASAIARLVAVDGPEATARRVAAVRTLRLLPFDHFQSGYRLAESRLTFTP